MTMTLVPELREAIWAWQLCLRSPHPSAGVVSCQALCSGSGFATGTGLEVSMSKEKQKKLPQKSLKDKRRDKKEKRLEERASVRKS
jgi:hypothetical protein